MKNQVITILGLMLLCVVPESAFSQRTLIEDFEGDLSNWTIIEGQMEISDTQVLAGNGALRMQLPSVGWANHILEHNTFNENFGRYDYHFFTDGDESDADLYFMYVNENHYYKVSCKPAGTDNPELIFCKGTPNGEVVLAALEPNFDQTSWVKVTVERWCDGHTHVYINDEQLISLDDYDHFDKGTIRLRGWAENTYIDEVYFEPHQTEVFVENMTICEGDSAYLGGRYRLHTGQFLDTISDESAPCLEVRDVRLAVQKRDTLHQHLNLCPGDSVEVDGAWIVEAGHFQFLTLDNGCEVMMDVTVQVQQSLRVVDTISFCPQEGPFEYAGIFSQYLIPGGDTMAAIVLKEEGISNFHGIDQNGCIQAVDLTALQSCRSLYIPNAFSPNGDGKNDRFEIAPMESGDEVHMMIFDRWGGKIFDGLNEYWDGQVDGQQVPNGVYLYMFTVNGVSYSGSVNLVR